MRLQGLTIVILHEVAHRAVEHTRLGGGEPGRVPTGRDALAPRLDADQPHRLVVEESVEDPHGVGSAANAGNHGVGQARASTPMIRWKSRTISGNG